MTRSESKIALSTRQSAPETDLSVQSVIVCMHAWLFACRWRFCIRCVWLTFGRTDGRTDWLTLDLDRFFQTAAWRCGTDSA